MPSAESGVVSSSASDRVSRRCLLVAWLWRRRADALGVGAGRGPGVLLRRRRALRGRTDGRSPLRRARRPRTDCSWSPLGRPSTRWREDEPTYRRVAGARVRRGHAGERDEVGHDPSRRSTGTTSRPADSIVRFAREHDMTVRGHTLVWYRQVPDWVTNGTGRGPSSRRSCTTTSTPSSGATAGKVAQWDVVNEALDDQRQAARQRVDARHRAGLHRPRVHVGARGRPRRPALLQRLRPRVPRRRRRTRSYELVRGLQAARRADRRRRHPGPRADRAQADDATELDAALRDYADLGLDVAITELDVGVLLPASTGRSSRSRPTSTATCSTRASRSSGAGRS